MMEFLLTHQKRFSQLLIKSQDFTQLCCFAKTPLSAVFSRSSGRLHYLQKQTDKITGEYTGECLQPKISLRCQRRHTFVWWPVMQLQNNIADVSSNNDADAASTAQQDKNMTTGHK